MDCVILLASSFQSLMLQRCCVEAKLAGGDPVKVLALLSPCSWLKPKNPKTLKPLSFKPKALEELA